MMLLLAACAPRYPGPAAPAERMSWSSSLAASPARHDRTDTSMFIEHAATPTAPLDLYRRSEGNLHTGPLVRGTLACLVHTLEPRLELGPTPDLRVEVELADRRTVLGFTDRTQLEFTIGLVDLSAGDRVRVRVLEDTLDGGSLLLEGEQPFNGQSPWGWTTRREQRRTSLRCRAPSMELLDEVVDQRLAAAWRAVRKQDRTGPELARDSVRNLAALVGWSDPRVTDLRERLHVPSGAAGR